MVCSKHRVAALHGSTTRNFWPEKRLTGFSSGCDGSVSTLNGNTIVNSLPTSTWLVTSISPFINRTSSVEMESPSPVPPNRRVVLLSACENDSKIDRCLSAGIPVPVSMTWIFHFGDSPRTISTRISTCPSDVNLIAFPRRLRMICRSFIGSPSILHGMFGGK